MSNQSPARSFTAAERRRSPLPSPTYCFAVHAVAEPDVLPRVLELFAKRNLVPTKCYSLVAGAELQVDIQMDGLESELGDFIARCLRQLVHVECVLTSLKAG
ncbi:MAG: hypothetical protein ACREE7_09270 [Dongiaceae bacterium]